VLKSNPDSVEALALLGESLRLLGRNMEAEEALRRGLSIEPLNARLHNELGSVLAQQGKIPEAKKSYREAIRLDPDLAEPRFNLARITEGDEAETLLRRAISLRPDYAAPKVELAKRLTAANRLQEASTQIRAALEQAPDDPETIFVAARIAELTGRRPDAAKLYRRFLDRVPADRSEMEEARRMAERRLEALGGRWYSKENQGVSQRLSLQNVFRMLKKRESPGRKLAKAGFRARKIGKVTL